MSATGIEVATWSDLVTTALLGTGRRPVPSGLPAWSDLVPAADNESAESRVLDLAAAHRVAAYAGRPVQHVAAGSTATAVPPQTLPLAPPAARELLQVFLGRPDGSAINQWSRACARHRCGAAPEHWAALAGLGARSTTYDRRLLGQVLGERGRWFVRQNPEWTRLARALDEPIDPPAAPARAGLGERPGEVPTAAPTPGTDQLRKDPELLLAVPDPWPAPALGAALAGLVDGRMGGNARPYARAIGARLTLAQYAELGRVAASFLELAQLNPAQRRAVRSLFVEIEKAAYDRVEIDRAFDPGTERIFKISIPHV